jgi:hypothetical protein
MLATCAPTQEVANTASEALAMAEQSGAQVIALERRVEDLEARLDDLEISVIEVERNAQRPARAGSAQEPCWRIGYC